MGFLGRLSLAGILFCMFALIAASCYIMPGANQLVVMIIGLVFNLCLAFFVFFGGRDESDK